MEQISRVVDKHEIQLNSHGGETEKTDEMAKAVLIKVKEGLNKSGTGNEVFDHILNIKMEIKDLK